MPTPTPPPTKLCQLCHLQGHKYTCPRCLIRYCSLACFKSKDHLDCVEGFYQNQVEGELRGRKVEGSKREILEMLQRLNKEDLDFSDFTIDEKVDEKVAQKQFDELVKSGEFGKLIEIWEPWWNLSQTPVPKAACMPKGLSITSSHPDLFYSLIDFIFSYVTGVRTLNGEVEDEEVREIIISISQVLSSKQKSNFVYASVHAVVEMMRFKFLSSPLGFNKESLPIFLNDVIEILARKEWVLVVLSEVSRIVKKKALVRKLDYFRVLVSDMDEKVLEVLRIGIKQEGFLLFDSSEGLTTPAAKKPLIEEI